LFDGLTCPYEHRGAVKKALHLLKFQRRRALARPLGERLAAVFVPQPGEAIVPVPLHAARQRERGFNQAELLARLLPGPVHPEYLRRTHATAHQYQQSDAVRLANVLRAFEAGPVKGQRIVLVDDIMTTGATLNACAETLRAAGALTVRAVTNPKDLDEPPEPTSCSSRPRPCRPRRPCRSCGSQS
jgi:ComF family protein